MKLKLKRPKICRDKGTLGDLYVNGEWECFILEDIDRQLETTPGNKIFGLTCIPRGTYGIVIDFSKRFKRDLPLLKDVPGFEGARIHPGNYTKDTEGCLLPGSSFTMLPNGEPMVINSKVAFVKLFTKLATAYDAGESIEIEIQ